MTVFSVTREADEIAESAWASPTGLAGALDDTDETLRRFVHFAQPEQPWAVALWCALSWVVNEADYAPRLAIRAPLKGSGKTRLLEVMEHLCSVSWRIVGPSAPVLYRKIERDQPTILWDEADRLFEKRREDVADQVQLLNAGHTRGTFIPRVEMAGGKGKLHDWPAYAAVALAGIGTAWPDTIMDRSIVVTLERKTADEAVERFGRAVQPGIKVVGDRLGEWVQGAVHTERPDPGTLEYLTVLPELRDRAQNNWEPLLALAELAGGHWPERARQAAIALSSGAAVEIESDRLEVRALRDVVSVMTGQTDTEGNPAPFLGSVVIVDRMLALEEAPWATITHGRPLTTEKLAYLMRHFGIASGQPVRGGPRGFLLAEVQAAYTRIA